MLSKVGEDYDPTNKLAAYTLLEESDRIGKYRTGVFYIDETQPNLVDRLNMVDTPISALAQDKLQPTRESLEELMASL